MLNNYLKHKPNQKYLFQVLKNFKTVRNNILYWLDTSTLAPSTLRKHYAVYQAYENYLFVRQEIPDLLFPKYKELLPRQKQVRPTALIPFELVPRIIELAPSPYNLILDLLFHLGCRRSEILNLTKDDVTETSIILRKTKNNKTYEIELSSRLSERLQAYIKNHTEEKLFPMSVTKFYLFFRSHLRRFGIKASPHATRATAATFLKSKGLCDRDVALSLHQAEATVRLYDKRSRIEIGKQYLGMIDYGKEALHR